MTEMRSTILIAALLFVTACSSTKAYLGPDLPAQDLSSIQGASTLCEGSYYIKDFDGQFEGQDLQAPAGSHRMKVTRVSRPFIGDDPNTSFIPGCVRVTGYEVSFETRAQHTYWFHADDSAPASAEITVWQSTGNGPQGQQIPSQSKELWSHRDCFIDGRYAQCFPGA